jgi:hypothetical protein
MSPELHLAKGERILAGMAKFRMPEDYLALIDASLIAGYHYGNALLHAAGVCPPDVHFNTPSKLDRPVAGLPPSIRPAFEAFEGLEALRTRHVRDVVPPDANLATTVRAHLETMRRAKG